MSRDNPHDISERAPAPRPWRVVMLGLLIVAATVVAYGPSLRGGFIWDDPEYVVNNPTLRSPAGLAKMWTDLHALPQWYPLVHTTYWVEYQFFGLNPLAFKLTNLALHGATALLLWRLLWRLRVPGAYLAAAVFALHPVHVESVAWITERKNALSGLFYVAAFLAMVRSGVGFQWTGLNGPIETDDARRTRWWLAALALFAAAMLSKTVTATFLPAVCVVAWWKRAPLRWTDWPLLVPFLVIGGYLGLITSGLERSFVGAVGPEWDYADTWHGELAARTLIAGRAAWFYAGKLIWPHPIAFMYDRWEIDPSAAWQWAFPVAAVALVAGLLLAVRRVGRGPLAAVLLFGGTLFPALGFFNVYPHRYSFVADHFQHLASIALTTLLCAGLVLAIRRWVPLARQAAATAATGGAICVALGAITFRQGFSYESVERLWRDTAQRSPRAWVAFTNLGKLLADQGKTDAAVAMHERALKLAPRVADTWYNVGSVRATRGDYAGAAEAFAKAAELSAGNPRAAIHLDALIALGRLASLHEGDAAKAEAYFRRALERLPVYPPANVQYARFLTRSGRAGEALDRYAVVIDLLPGDFDARAEAGALLLNAGQFPAAAEQLEVAVQVRPTSAAAWAQLGWARLGMNDRGGARMAFAQALAIEPSLEPARRGMERVQPP